MSAETKEINPIAKYINQQVLEICNLVKLKKDTQLKKILGIKFFDNASQKRSLTDKPKIRLICPPEGKIRDFTIAGFLAAQGDRESAEWLRKKFNADACQIALGAALSGDIGYVEDLFLKTNVLSTIGQQSSAWNDHFVILSHLLRYLVNKDDETLFFSMLSNLKNNDFVKALVHNLQSLLTKKNQDTLDKIPYPSDDPEHASARKKGIEAQVFCGWVWEKIEIIQTLMGKYAINFHEAYTIYGSFCETALPKVIESVCTGIKTDDKESLPRLKKYYLSESSRIVSQYESSAIQRRLYFMCADSDAAKITGTVAEFKNLSIRAGEAEKWEIKGSGNVVKAATKKIEDLFFKSSELLERVRKEYRDQVEEVMEVIEEATAFALSSCEGIVALKETVVASKQEGVSKVETKASSSPKRDLNLPEVEKMLGTIMSESIPQARAAMEKIKEEPNEILRFVEDAQAQVARINLYRMEITSKVAKIKAELEKVYLIDFRLETRGTLVQSLTKAEETQKKMAHLAMVATDELAQVVLRAAKLIGEVDKVNTLVDSLSEKTKPMTDTDTAKPKEKKKDQEYKATYDSDEHHNDSLRGLGSDYHPREKQDRKGAISRDSNEEDEGLSQQIGSNNQPLPGSSLKGPAVDPGEKKGRPAAVLDSDDEHLFYKGRFALLEEDDSQCDAENSVNDCSYRAPFAKQDEKQAQQVVSKVGSFGSYHKSQARRDPTPDQDKSPNKIPQGDAFVETLTGEGGSDEDENASVNENGDDSFAANPG